jgi:hypothetical protein
MHTHLSSSVRPFLLPALLAALTASSGGCFVFPEGGSGTGTGTAPTTCGQDSTCPLSQPCLATTENAGAPRFGMRIAELTLRAPLTLTDAAKSVIGGLFESSFLPALPQCSSALDAGTSSWLLQFDLDQETLTMGGAALPGDPESAVAFLDTMIGQGSQTYHVAPVTFDLAQGADGTLGTAAALDLDLPLFFIGQENAVVLPLHALSASEITVSSSHDCIGSYDPAIFNWDQDHCAPTTPDQLFRHAGRIQAFLSLAEADALAMPVVGETLCAALAGIPSQSTLFSSNPITHCPSTNGVIDFQGDWCSTTNAPATATCADAVHVVADFAANAQQIQE